MIIFNEIVLGDEDKRRTKRMAALEIFSKLPFLDIY